MNELQFRLAVDCYVDAMVVACRRPSFDCRLAATHFWILLDDFFQKLLNLPQTAHNLKLKTPIIYYLFYFILFY
jgi:hypothetical protein